MCSSQEYKMQENMMMNSSNNFSCVRNENPNISDTREISIQKNSDFLVENCKTCRSFFSNFGSFYEECESPISIDSMTLHFLDIIARQNEDNTSDDIDDIFLPPDFSDEDCEKEEESIPSSLAELEEGQENSKSPPIATIFDNYNKRRGGNNLIHKWFLERHTIKTMNINPAAKDKCIRQMRKDASIR